jgi:hypothetical protein
MEIYWNILRGGRRDDVDPKKPWEGEKEPLSDHWTFHCRMPTTLFAVIIVHLHLVETFEDMMRERIITIDIYHDSMLTFEMLSPLRQTAAGPCNDSL